MSVNLKDMVTTDVHLRPPKIVVYGVGGVGKTTFAAGAPSPIFLFTEEGQGKLRVPRFRGVAKSWETVMEAVAMLYQEEHDYQTFVLDNLYFLEPLLHRHTCEKYHEKVINAPTKEFGFNKGYERAAEEAMVLLDGLDALRDERGMSVVLVGHSKVKHFNDPESDGYDQYQLDVNDKFGNRIRNWCDAMLFMNFRSHVVSDEDSRKGRKRGVGVGERVLRTEDRPSSWGKNRYSLPPEIDLPGTPDPAACWAAFQDAIVAEPAQQEPQQETKED